MTKNYYLTALCAFIFLTSYGQPVEKLTVMTYNLLNYRNTTSSCTSSSNNPTTKEANLNTIVLYTQPDILVCQEIGGASAQPVDQLLMNALNINGETKYSKANYTNNGSSSLVNMVYFDNTKLVLTSQDFINKDLSGNNLVRLIDVYRFYYKDPLLNKQSDTVFITVLAAHLKAGTGGSNEIQRKDATAAVMSYVQGNISDDNVIFCGDLNVYKSQELAYQNLINHSNSTYNFIDPINKPGVWNNNSTFAAYHTQSTHASGSCFSGGGLDDRFDQLLVSSAIMNNSDGVNYVTNSYKALGNDGLHFNQSINNGTNNSAPSSIINALYDLSDHLPVLLELEISQMSIGLNESTLSNSDVLFENPVNEILNIRLNESSLATSSRVIDLQGRTLAECQFNTDVAKVYCEMNVSNLPKGAYLLQIATKDGKTIQQKFLKN
jgi:endonuclease/exonuclease/phosphatase family metal-dependent hydrolase